MIYSKKSLELPSICLFLKIIKDSTSTIDSSLDVKTNKFGVIQSADFHGRVCNVRWLYFSNDASVTTDQVKRILITVYHVTFFIYFKEVLTFNNLLLCFVLQLEEDISVYDIADHPDFSFRPGDTVVRLSPTDLYKASKGSEEGQKKEEEQKKKERLSSIGQVILNLI